MAAVERPADDLRVGESDVKGSKQEIETHEYNPVMAIGHVFHGCRVNIG